MKGHTPPPAWFNLERYKRGETTLSKHSKYLATQLEYRRLLLAHMELKTDSGLEISKAIFNAIKAHTYPTRIQLNESTANAGIRNPVGLRYCRQGDIDDPVKELDYRSAYKLQELIPQDDLEILRSLHTARDVKSFDDLNIRNKNDPLFLTKVENRNFTDRCLEIENEVYFASRLPRRRVFLSVDLEASNAEIKKSLDSVLTEIRTRNEQTGYTKNRTSITLEKRKNIIESGLFPYLDLKVHAQLEGLNFANLDLIDWIHADNQSSISETAFKKSTLVHAERCLNQRFIQNLIIQGETEASN